VRAFFFLALFLCIVPVTQAYNYIFQISDPYNDDYGDGSLAYPVRSDLRAGDLDLRSFAAWKQGDGTVFQATFARHIESPGYITIDASGTLLSQYARFGFYTFNIDLYIDTDRIPGSGFRQTLPGRHAEVSRNNAWEKAVLLTPRPYEAKTLLERSLRESAEAEFRKMHESLSDADKKQIRSRVQQLIKDRYFIATQIRVVGPSIQFYVPNSFLGGPAKNEWSYAVAVSAADIRIQTDIAALFGRSRGRVDNLLIVPVTEGRSTDTFGETHERDSLQSPLIDILVPFGERQEDILTPDGKDSVQLPGVVPSAEN
jgi:hypothetical protein